MTEISLSSKQCIFYPQSFHFEPIIFQDDILPFFWSPKSCQAALLSSTTKGSIDPYLEKSSGKPFYHLEYRKQLSYIWCKKCVKETTVCTDVIKESENTFIFHVLKIIHKSQPEWTFMEHKVHVVHRNLCENFDNYTVCDDIKLPDMSPLRVTFCATFVVQIFLFFSQPCDEPCKICWLTDEWCYKILEHLWLSLLGYDKFKLDS